MRAISLKDLLNDTFFIGHEPPSLNKNLSAFFRYRQRWSQIVTGSTSEIRVAEVWTVGSSEKEELVTNRHQSVLLIYCLIDYNKINN